MSIKRAAAALGALAIGGGLVVVTTGVTAAHAGVPGPVWSVDQPTFDPITVVEGNSGTTDLTFNLINAVPGPACNVRVVSSWLPENALESPPSATGGSDYLTFSQVIQLPANATSFPVTIKVVGDTVAENDESVLLILASQGLSNPCAIGFNGFTDEPEFSAALSATLGYDPSSTDYGWGVILNDDAPELTLTMDPTLDICESALPTHTVTAHLALNRALVAGETLDFDWSTANGFATSPGDYLGDSGHVSISYPEPTTDITFEINVVDDFLPEGEETFDVVISNVVYTGSNGSSVVDGSQTIFIENDDIVGNEISVSDPVVTEGTGGTTTMTFTVSSLYPAICDGIELHVHTADGTATAPGDYGSVDTTVIIPEGETSVDVPVDIVTDSDIEADETLSLIVDSPAGVQGDLEGVGTIIDDDFPSVKVYDSYINEGNSGTSQMVFDLVLSDLPAKTASLEYTTTNGSALHGADYNTATGSVTFAPGEWHKTVAVDIIGDTVPELDENFTLKLSSLSNLEVDDLNGTGVILNDDAWLFYVGDTSVVEGNPPGGVTASVSVTLNAPAPPGGFGLCWSTSNNTAVAPDDFTATSLCNDNFTIPQGGTSATITVPITSDEVHEDSEQFIVNIDDWDNAGSTDCDSFTVETWNGGSPVTDGICGTRSLGAGDSEGVVTIIDDDPEDLPETGSNVGLMLTFGLGFLGAGMILMGARKRRSTIS